jgi:transcription initiation factor TFIIE subunit beta
MSFLEKQSSVFKNSLASAASKLSNAKTATTTSSTTGAGSISSLAPPAPASPTPSATSDGATPTAKRKRDAVTEVYSQPALTGFGHDVKTNTTFAIVYLKAKGEGKTAVDVLGHLNMLNSGEDTIRELVDILRRHNKIDWRPDPNLTEQTPMSGTYSYRPLVPGVRDGESLLAYLQRKTDASGVLVKELKDGWPDCEDTIARLERQHRVVVSRTQKDGLMRGVWLNDPSLHHNVQPEFVAMWHRVPLPSLDDMHRKLVSVGQKPTSDDPLKAKEGGPAKPKAQKKRAGKRAGKATNVHMAHLMQDYSSLRR